MKFEIQDGEGNADIRVCATQRCHPDDLEGECSECHHAIFYRPDPPFLIKFLCLDCAIKLTGGLENMKEVRVSSNTIKEIKSILENGGLS